MTAAGVTVVSVTGTAAVVAADMVAVIVTTVVVATVVTSVVAIAAAVVAVAAAVIAAVIAAVAAVGTRVDGVSVSDLSGILKVEVVVVCSWLGDGVDEVYRRRWRCRRR